ncbi:MAG: hypothetical protein GEV06_01315 [Luteitalea sp.]|nr:hypothetical protein [Luteitalea sp.]
MRTTIDLPNDLFRAAKARAASQGESLKTLVTRAVESLLGQPGGAGGHERAQVPLFGDPRGAKVELTNDTLARIEADEDVDYVRRTSRRS